MAFYHSLGGLCCICKEKPFRQLHHFGSGGGRGMKPNDLDCCRMCQECAMAHEVKATAMIRDGRWELLATMHMDSAELKGAYIEYLEGRLNGNKQD
jgi:hypothetical protein